MPSLSHKRLHTRPFMLRALVRAGQFAHVQPAAIEHRLDELYDPNLRFARLRGRFSSHDADRAVSWTLLRARRFLAEPVYEAGTVDYIGSVEGVTCCLCLGIEERPAYIAPHPLPLGFVSYVCPTFLRFEGERNPHTGMEWCQSGLPLCGHCRRAISNRFWREFAWKIPERAAIWADALAWLLNNPAFRKRVEKNAGNVRLLRFDPRRLPKRRLAA